MPVPRLISAVMDSLKSAELIQELKVETEKLIESNSMVAKAEVDCILSLEPEYSYDKKPNHLIPCKRNVIPYPDHNYGQQPPLTPPEQASPDPNEQTDTGNEDEDEEGVTRCICGFDHDDGYMICCDRCGSWQHIDCMGIKSDSVPETYHCDRCEPRQLDVERARAIQQRKKDTLTDDDGDDDTDTDEESGQTYTAVSQTPTRITLTANAVIKKKGKNRLKSTGSVVKTKKRKKVNRKRQRTSTVQLNDDSILQIDTNSVESQIGPENFQEIEECVYDQAVTDLGLQDTENCAEVIKVDAKRAFTLADVADNRKGLIATEDFTDGQFVIEYKGKVLLATTYEEANPFFKRSCPFILHYNKIDQLELVVDARQVGNEARYLRRSCCPNTEVTHAVKDGSIRVLVLSRQPIATGTEITIPFEFPIETYPGFVECACKDPLCVASKHNQQYLPASGRKRSRYSVTDPNSSTRNSASENQGETDSDDNEVDGTRCLSRRKKLSREERKLQAYLKQIEKMEKKQKKGRDPKATPSRSGMVPDACQPQGTLNPRSSQAFEPNALQSPTSCVPRRIASCTPGSSKKRLSVSKKRPRISSCSSDPLSPEVACPISTTVNTTPLQEHLISAQNTPEHNGLLKPKTRRERENLALSVAIDKIVPNLKDQARRQKRDYLETVTGSPTPPSTPGQLSPSVSQANSILSVDTSSNHVSPSGLSMQDKRSMLNGLLQIANHNDGSLVCADSPHDSVTTSNGLVTAEEVMGEMTTRENTVLTPTGKLPTRRTMRECRYFGSLKKRWLVQYDRHSVMEMRPRNGISSVSLTNIMNDFSIQKRAEQIASYVFKTPKNYIPVKKRRLKELMLLSSEEKKEVNVIADDGDGALETEKGDDRYLSVGDAELDNLKAETGATNHDETMHGESVTDETRNSVKINQDVLDRDMQSEGISEGEKCLVTDCEAADKQKTSHDGEAIGNGASVLSFDPRKEEPNENVFGMSLSQVVASNTNKITMVSHINSSTYSSEKPTFRFVSDVSSDSHPVLSSNMGSNPDLPVNHTGSMSICQGTNTLSDDASEKLVEVRTTLSKSVVNSSVTFNNSDPISATENSVVEPESIVNSSSLCAVPNELQVKPSSILRDPRLSSSSSRSSRDSTDGNVFIRSDSVSSVEDSMLHKSNPERKQHGEKFDGTSNTKKKMSLREYRNRKKAKPISVVQNSNTANNEVISNKTQVNHQSVLLTDTDSLLTPRTLSLSNAFVTLPGKDATLTTTATSTGSLHHDASVLDIPMPQHQSAEIPSNGPMFEPVSPSDDFISIDSAIEKGDVSSTDSQFSRVNDMKNSTTVPTSDGMQIDPEFSPSPGKAVEADHRLTNVDSLTVNNYSYLSPKHLGRQGSNSVYQVQQEKPVGINRDGRSPVYRQAHTYNQQFHG